MNTNAIAAVMMITLMMTGTVSAAAPGSAAPQDTTDVFAGQQNPADGADKGSDSNNSTDDDNTADDSPDQQEETASTDANMVVVVVNNTNTNLNENLNQNINDNTNTAQANAMGVLLELLSSESVQELLDQLDITADGNLTIEIQA